MAFEQDPSTRISRIFQTIQDKTMQESSQGRLQLYVYCMSALNQHLLFEVLNEKDIRSIIELVQSILNVEGIKRQGSKLSYLHLELHYAISQLHRKDGQLIAAAWEHEISLRSESRNQKPNIALDEFVLADQKIGLGFIASGLEHLLRASTLKPDPALERKIFIHQLRCLRFLHRFEEFENLASEGEKRFFDSDRISDEILWEKSCVSAIQSRKLVGLYNLCKRESSHYRASYLLELYFWIHAFPTNRFQKDYSKIATLARKKELNLKDYGLFYRIAVELEKADDQDIPFSVRLSNLKKIVSQYEKIVDVDKRALILVSLVRWLQKTNQHRLATLIHLEYKALSLRISDGAHDDFLLLFNS